MLPILPRIFRISTFLFSRAVCQIAKEAHEDNLGVEIEGFGIERRLLNSSSKPTKKMMWSIGISRQESRNPGTNSDDINDA